MLKAYNIFLILVKRFFVVVLVCVDSGWRIHPHHKARYLTTEGILTYREISSRVIDKGESLGGAFSHFRACCDHSPN